MVKRILHKSVEPNIADLANGWLKSYGLDYKLEQENLNNEIDKALNDYQSKSGGSGTNRPDVKLLLRTKKNLKTFPVLIEYKGYENRLEKLDAEGNIDNQKKDNSPNYTNIKNYAVNGAIHYANALLHYTSYTDIIAIGMTGYKNFEGKLVHSIGVYYVSKENLGVGQKVGEFTDLSFLKFENFDTFIERVVELKLSADELQHIKEKREQEIDTSLTKLNNDIYQNESGLSEQDRVHLVAASIIATIGVPGKVSPLEKEELKSSTEKGNTDGEIILRKIEAFLEDKKENQNFPQEKKDLIIRSLKNTILAENVNKVINGETQLKRVFTKIVDDLGYYYKIGLTTDFTGKLFNEMYSWLGFTQDKLNDVVLTPSYVSALLVKLAKINRNSFVWDFATGSAGLLVAAMNEMLNDAKEEIQSPEELAKKEAHIKAKQLLGIELLPSIYMLAILNMILMGDGSSNILNKNSLTDFNGNYGFTDKNKKFPADAFILNPPYSAEGNGMVFVEKALNMMDTGYAAIIIQNSAGSGRAREINKRILKRNRLIASIKMPIDLFIGKSSVQTNIYVFRVNEKHEPHYEVKFIDFSNDGYTRRSRKKSKASVNLKNIDNANERYAELVKLVHGGRNNLHLFTNKEYYESTIDPTNGADWNQSAPVDTLPMLEDFQKTVESFLSWELSGLVTKHHPIHEEVNRKLTEKLSTAEWCDYKLDELFEKVKVKKLNYKVADLPKSPTIDYPLPALTAGILNQGLNNYVPKENATVIKNVLTISANGANTGATFFQNKEFTVLQDAYAIKYKKDNYIPNNKQYLYLAGTVSKAIYGKYEWTNKAGWEKIKNNVISLPQKNGKIDYQFMEEVIYELERIHHQDLDSYLKQNYLEFFPLTEEEKKLVKEFRANKLNKTW